MKTNKNTYILFLFVADENQDDFITMVSEEIAVVSRSFDVRYYYGPQSAIFVLTSDKEFNDLSQYIKIIFSDGETPYMFLPLDKTNMTSGFGEEIDRHLFGPTPLSVNSIDVSDLSKLKDDNNKFKDEFNDMCFDDDDEDDNFFNKLLSKPYVPTVNEILDKIGRTGINSLTKDEKEILDNYSKQL